MKVFVLKDSITGEYVTSSTAQDTPDDDINFAKRYSESGARSAARYYNNVAAIFHERDLSLKAMYPAHADYGNYNGESERNWEIIEL